METVGKRAIMLFTLLFVLSLCSSCIFSPEGYNQSFFHTVQPNLVDFTALGESSDEFYDDYHICVDGENVYALLGNTLYIIKEKTFEVTRSENISVEGHGDGVSLKPFTSTADVRYLYFTDDGTALQLSGDSMDTVEAPSLENENINSHYTYFVYEGSDYMAGWTFETGVEVWDLENSSLSVTIELPEKTQPVDIEWVNSALYIIHAPLKESPPYPVAPLGLSFKSFGPDVGEEATDGVYSDWSGTKQLAIMEKCNYENHTIYANTTYYAAAAGASLNENGILVYNAESAQAEPGIAAFDLEGDLQIRHHIGGDHHNRDFCLSPSGDFYYMLNREGVYKYRVR
jgi:hypothetical protein